MSLTLEQVFAKVTKGEDIGYVFDAPVHYIVLTRHDNTFNMNFIEKYLAILDKIEAS